MASSSTHSKPAPLVVLTGPTASGKSSAAMSLALNLGGEILSADSMQLYRGLDIGSAKPTPEEQAKVRHHLLDTLDISERGDLFRYIEMADKAIAEIRAKGAVPIVAGGTGLYVKSLICGLDPIPSDPELRRRLDIEYGIPERFTELKELMRAIDPEDFDLWKAHQRKLLRALEVFKLSGVPLRSLQEAWRNSEPRHDCVSIMLSWERDELKRRIKARCEEMLRSGWIEEAKSLLDKGLLASPTARQAIGYAQIDSHLKGELDFGQLKEAICLATWQFARRQLTWFRNQPPKPFELRMPAEGQELLSTVKKLMR